MEEERMEEQDLEAIEELEEEITEEQTEAEEEQTKRLKSGLSEDWVEPNYWLENCQLNRYH